MKDPVPGPDRAAQLLFIVDALVAEVRLGGNVNATLDSVLDKDLGLDSLARVELLARIEKAFEVRLGDEVLGTAETPRDLLRAIVAGAPDRVGAAEIEADIDIRPGVGIIVHEHRRSLAAAAAAIGGKREKIKSHAIGGVRQGGKEPLFLVGA